MAKVVAEFDTVAKTLSVSIDGSPVENVRAVNMGPSWEDDDEFSMCVFTRSEDPVAKTSIDSRLCASKADGSVRELPGPARGLASDIASFLGRG